MSAFQVRAVIAIVAGFAALSGCAGAGEEEQDTGGEALSFEPNQPLGQAGWAVPTVVGDLFTRADFRKVLGEARAECEDMRVEELLQLARRDVIEIQFAKCRISAKYKNDGSISSVELGKGRPRNGTYVDWMVGLRAANMPHLALLLSDQRAHDMIEKLTKAYDGALVVSWAEAMSTPLLRVESKAPAKSLVNVQILATVVDPKGSSIDGLCMREVPAETGSPVYDATVRDEKLKGIREVVAAAACPKK